MFKNILFYETATLNGCKNWVIQNLMPVTNNLLTSSSFLRIVERKRTLHDTETVELMGSQNYIFHWKMAKDLH